MANNKLLGCWGLIVGAVVIVIVGWMAFELLIGFLAGLRLDGMGTFADPLLWHEAGELLIVGLSILSIYVWVFRGPGLAHFATSTRYAFWLGATLNVAAWIGLPAGARWSWWTLTLIILGVTVPLLLSRLAASTPPPTPPH